MSNLLKVFLLSAVPIAEQRGAIPLGIIGYDLNPSCLSLSVYQVMTAASIQTPFQFLVPSH